MTLEAQALDLEEVARRHEGRALRIERDEDWSGTDLGEKALAEERRLATSLRTCAAVARAFPKMLGALENIRQIEEYVKGRPCLCGEPGCVQCLAISALRAAREAVKP